MTTNKPVKMTRTRPTASEMDSRWKERQSRTRKSGKVNRGQGRNKKRTFECEI
tara:strand:- start:3436 stop:3594 length:159 start_codon:yes stop_codon:yes gene_type:complete